MGDNVKCLTCRFWQTLYTDQPDDQAQGECRRHPPTWTKEDSGVWPETAGVDFCGEWQPRRDGK